MLSSAETIDVIADCLVAHGGPPVVLDPVRCVYVLRLLLGLVSNVER